MERLLDIDLKQLSLIHRGFSVLDAAPYRNIPCLEMALEMKKRFPDYLFFAIPVIFVVREACCMGSVQEHSGWIWMVYLSNRIAVRRWHCRMQAQQLTPEALGKMFENLGIRQVENNKLHLGCEILIQRKG